MNRHRKPFLAVSLIAAAFLTAASAQQAKKGKPEPLMIQEQGSFAVGGKIITNPGTFNPKQPTTDGQTLHGDHAYVFYQIPVNRRKLPLVFLHGTGQFSKTWETTPDGREGFQTIFLRQRFPVYLIDQPRRGNAGRSTVSATINATPDEQMWFDTFRVGIWPEFFPGVQFSKDPEALNQYFRQMTPNVGPYDPEVISEACAALFNKLGPAVFVTHSQGGGLGWATVLKTGNVRAIVSYEPGSGFLFPEGEVPETLPSSGGALAAIGVPLAEFMKLTKIPVIIFYGDFIPEMPSDNPGQDGWRVRLEMARKWRDTVNRHGGDVTVVHLPEVGVHGNTHFPFSDLNNKQVADLMSKFLSEKKLDRSGVSCHARQRSLKWEMNSSTKAGEFLGAAAQALSGVHVAGSAMATPHDTSAVKEPAVIGYTNKKGLTIERVTYPARNTGTTIVANLFKPAGFDVNRRYAAVVVTHPFGGVKEQTSGLYAQHLAEQGFITLAYDASYQGESGGQPRLMEVPAQRLDDISCAIDFLVTHPQVEAGRIGSLGICAGGGYALCNATT